MIYPWHLYAMACMYILAGIMHFIKPKMYMRIMPKYIPNHKLMVLLSGVAEIILGATLCFPSTKNAAIYGIILMLLVFFTVHFYMLSNEKASAGLIFKGITNTKNKSYSVTHVHKWKYE